MRDSKRDTDIKNRLLDSVGVGEGGVIWENNIETCILTTCEIDHQSKFDAWDRALKAGAPGQPWRMEVGGGFRIGGYMYTHGWFMSMYGKNCHNIVISFQLK